MTWRSDISERFWPSKAAVARISDRRRAMLRPIAETLAMLDGNAFFGIERNEAGDDTHWQQYLPEAWSLFESNGGMKGWAGRSAIAASSRKRVR